METLVIKSVSLELRKINATKLKLSENTKFQTKSMNEDDLEDFKSNVDVNLGLKQRADKSVLSFFLSYHLPAYLDYDMEIDAGFVGEIQFEKPYDIEKPPKDGVDEKKAEIARILLPAIFKEVDAILQQVFDMMHAHYLPLSKFEEESKADHDS